MGRRILSLGLLSLLLLAPTHSASDGNCPPVDLGHQLPKSLSFCHDHLLRSPGRGPCAGADTRRSGESCSSPRG